MDLPRHGQRSTTPEVELTITEPDHDNETGAIIVATLNWRMNHPEDIDTFTEIWMTKEEHGNLTWFTLDGESALPFDAAHRWGKRERRVANELLGLVKAPFLVDGVGVPRPKDHVVRVYPSRCIALRLAYGSTYNLQPNRLLLSTAKVFRNHCGADVFGTGMDRCPLALQNFR